MIWMQKCFKQSQCQMYHMRKKIPVLKTLHFANTYQVLVKSLLLDCTHIAPDMTVPELSYGMLIISFPYMYLSD